MDSDVLGFQQSLSPLGTPPDLAKSTNDRFAPEKITAIRNKTDEFEESWEDTYLYHYQQMHGEWGGVEALVPLLDDLGFDPYEHSLTTTVIGGFTGEFAKALADVGFEVVFTDPMSGWVNQAVDEGFEAYQYAAAELPANLIARTDVFATFECYYPFKTSAQYAIYSLLRLLTTAEGILLAETPLTREIRQAAGEASESNLVPIDIFSDHFGTCWRKTDSSRHPLRLYQYYQDDTSRRDILKTANVARCLYDMGTNTREITVTHERVNKLADSTGLGSSEQVYRRLIQLRKVYETFLGNEFASSTEDFAIGYRKFIYEF